MYFPKIFVASVLSFSVLSMTACFENSSKSNTPSVDAAVASEKAKMALYGDIDAEKTKEVGDSRPSLLLDDEELDYAGFGMVVSESEIAETAVARAESDASNNQSDVVDDNVSLITNVLVEDGASVNQLVNRSIEGIEAAVAIVVLDVEYISGGRSSADIRNVLLTELGSDADISVLPLGSNSGREFRVSLAFWESGQNLYTWIGVYATDFADQVKAVYGDVNNGTAVTSVDAVNAFISASQTFNLFVDFNNEADILWVIDNSGSMGQEQDNLGNGIDQFLVSLDNAGVNYQLAVTTTDGRYCDELSALPNDASSNFISPTTPDRESQWGDDYNGIARPGTSGSATETGFYCADKVDLTGFDRETAPNIVVFVSDEPENESVGESLPSGVYGSEYSPRDFNTYKQIFIDSGATYFAITGPSTEVRPTFNDPFPGYETDPNCSGEGGRASGGAHYRAITVATGGSFSSICASSTSWEVMFEQIIQTATGLASSFKLDYPPKPSTLIVKINGTAVNRDTSHNNGFDVVYGSEEASIVFYGEQARPEASDEIAISYDHISR
jgi:hypothetical protein